jgi:hypothetical protein
MMVDKNTEAGEGPLGFDAASTRKEPIALAVKPPDPSGEIFRSVTRAVS